MCCGPYLLQAEVKIVNVPHDQLELLPRDDEPLDAAGDSLCMLNSCTAKKGMPDKDDNASHTSLVVRGGVNRVGRREALKGATYLFPMSMNFLKTHDVRTLGEAL